VAVAEFAFPDRTALAAAVAARLATLLEEAIARDGSASLVVPGGSTPVAVFQALAMRDLAWANVNVLPCDERWVAVDHADSNEGLIRRHLLTGKAGEARVLALYRPVPTPADALPDVTRALKAVKRPFDAVFLGMGEDGHIASLFPGRKETAPALDLACDDDLMILAEPAKGHPRIGLTLKALTDARQIILAVPGAEKRAVLNQAMHNRNDDRLPVAALLRQNRAPLDIMYCS
jgi:6-phosphogluconolactonase